MNAPLVLALVCGICLPSFFGPADAVHDVPENLKREIQKLAVHFENGQRLLLQESLEVSNRILMDMLNQTQDVEIRMSIKTIRDQMEHLRKNQFDSREHALMRRLQDLWALKTSDTTVQRKAVRELLTVLQSAFQLHRPVPRGRHSAEHRPPRPAQR
ncbi:hypothetical protein SKAU_G00040700 [Synaphobranchus kaupii]|uniref:Uncharacterized protein n=1 Tax=Synaphobranchus kaupii TaxID=118154 RepID=A0A9Q1G2C3_SYNKA|nr:hypothetical protein SKAU_G00040700 [Synaphobranchus kaupii]